MVVREKEDEAEMVTEAGKAHAGIDPEIISLASSLTEEGTRVRAILAQKAMGRTQAMAGDDTHEGEVTYEAAIHEMVEDFKRIQGEHKAEMASANSQLRQALVGNRLRDHINLSLAKAHRYAMEPVADVARQ